MKKFNEMAAYVASMLALIALMFYFGIMARTLGDKLEATEYSLQATSEELAAAQDELANTNEMLRIEEEKVVEMSENIGRISAELDAANATIETLSGDEYQLVYMGEFKISYYCDQRFNHICGGSGVTASGKPTEVGVTAAADWDVLPRGSMVYINGVGFREIQDVGGGVNGNHLDVLVETHDEAINLGTDQEGVWLLVKNN